MSPIIESTIPELQSSMHLVTLVNEATGGEVCITVKTFTGAFHEVVAAANRQRRFRRLWGYEIFETMPLSN